MDNFNFNADFFNSCLACEELDEEQGKELAWAILKYVYEGAEPENLEGAAKVAFLMGRGRFDAAVNGAKGSKKEQAPSHRGVSEKEQPPLPKGGTPEKTDPPTVKKEKEKEKELKEELPNGSSKKAPKRFQRPSLDEIRDYVKSHDLANVDPERFYAYYESNGWKVGRNPMKSWVAALQNWDRRDAPKTTKAEEVANDLRAEFAPYL